MRFGFVVAALTVLLAGSHSEVVSQQPEAWIVGRAGDALAISQRAGPFAMLLDRATELALTSNQIGRIRDIQRRLVRTNEPLQAQIRDAELWGIASEEEEAGPGVGARDLPGERDGGGARGRGGSQPGAARCRRAC